MIPGAPLVSSCVSTKGLGVPSGGPTASPAVLVPPSNNLATLGRLPFVVLLHIVASPSVWDWTKGLAVTGIEPVIEGYEPSALPLGYTASRLIQKNMKLLVVCQKRDLLTMGRVWIQEVHPTKDGSAMRLNASRSRLNSFS